MAADVKWVLQRRRMRAGDGQRRIGAHKTSGGVSEEQRRALRGEQRRSERQGGCCIQVGKRRAG